MWSIRSDMWLWHSAQQNLWENHVFTIKRNVWYLDKRFEQSLTLLLEQKVGLQVVLDTFFPTFLLFWSGQFHQIEQYSEDLAMWVQALRVAQVLTPYYNYNFRYLFFLSVFCPLLFLPPVLTNRLILHLFTLQVFQEPPAVPISSVSNIIVYSLIIRDTINILWW